MNIASEQQKETDFLRWCIRCHESAAGRQLEAQLAQTQRNERCLRRAGWLVAHLGALAVAGIGYAMIFEDSLSDVRGVFSVHIIPDVIGALLLGSLISLLAFTIYGLVNRRELNRQREAGRQLVRELLESRLDGMQATRRDMQLAECGSFALSSEPVASAPDAGRGSNVLGTAQASHS